MHTHTFFLNTRWIFALFQFELLVRKYHSSSSFSLFFLLLFFLSLSFLFFFFLFEAKVVSSNFRWAREFCMEKNLLSGNEWLIWPRASTGICTISYHVQCQSTLSNIPLGLYWLFGKILELVSLVSFLHVKILAFQMIFTGYSTEGNIKNSLKWNFGSILIWGIYSERKSP